MGFTEGVTAGYERNRFLVIHRHAGERLLYEKDSSRARIIATCEDRFGLAARTADLMIAEQKPYLTEKQAGHEKVFAINLRSRPAGALV